MNANLQPQKKVVCCLLEVRIQAGKGGTCRQISEYKAKAWSTSRATQRNSCPPTTTTTTKTPQNKKQKQVRVQIVKSKLPFLKSMDYKVTLLKWYKSVTEEISGEAGGAQANLTGSFET